MPDIANANVQSIYGVYDPPAGNVTPLVRGNLLPQTLSTALLGATPVRIITGTAPNIPTQPGWFIDLSLESGERVINDPRLETGGELVLTTYEPMPGSCTATGASYFMVLNFATGGSFTTPQFDANGDGKINSSDTVVPTSGPDAGMAVAPVGISLGNVYASAPTIRSGSFGTGTGIALVTESTVGGVSNPTIQPFILKGATKSRTAWWEIRQ